MTGHQAWMLFCGLWWLAMGVGLILRGKFFMPLHGNIGRASDPLSFWVIVGFFTLVGVFLMATAF